MSNFHNSNVPLKHSPQIGYGSEVVSLYALTVVNYNALGVEIAYVYTTKLRANKSALNSPVFLLCKLAMLYTAQQTDFKLAMLLYP